MNKDLDALYAAAMAGDADAIVKLEMEDDKIQKDGDTILHVESRKGNIERVRFILRELAHRNLLTKLNNDKYKDTALYCAIYWGHTQVAEILIEAARHLPVPSFQAFLRQPEHCLDTALHAAVRYFHPSIVKLLVEADPDDRHIQDDEGKTPMYTAVEKGYNDMVEIICTTCTAPSLDGPNGTTALHAAIKNLDKAKEKCNEDVIRMIIDAAKRWVTPPDAPQGVTFEALFNQTDESGHTVLELAVMGNHVNVVDLILKEDPAYQPAGREIKRNGLMRLIFKAIDNEYTDDIIELLSKAYEAGIDPHHKGVLDLILAIKRRDQDSVLRLLRDAKNLATFTEDNGWTPLHYAVYHEFDSILDAIIKAQDVGHQFVYENMVSTPFHVAAEHGYTSTLVQLMELWSASASIAVNSPYTVVDKDSRNILHLAAAADNRKEMVQAILKYCPEKYKDQILKQQDINGDTPLHLLIYKGCYISEVIKKGLDTMVVKNKKGFTPLDMLYLEKEIVGDQVQIKIALDGIQIDPTSDIFSSSVLSISMRERKNVILNEQAKRMMHEKYARIKEDTRAFANCFADAIAGDPISKAALEMKADTVLNESGETILHVESRKGDIENVLFIVSAFANKSLLGRLDRSKQTALHLAALHGHTQVVEALIDAARHLPSSSSANDDAHNTVSSFQDFIRQANVPKRNTTLHLAVLNGNVAIVKLLVEADPNDRHVQNNEGKTPIYIAAENGYKDIVKEICTTCTALSLDGPGGRTTALHALIQNIGQVTTEEASDMIRMMVHAAKRWSSAEDPSLVNFEALFSTTDESGSTVLQLVVERNYVDSVELILLQDPANYLPGGKIKRNGLMRLIYKAIDNKYSNDIIELLSKAYEAGIDHDHKGVLALILDIKRRHEDSVLGHLRDAKNLVSFKEDNGWTPLHYAVYHEFDSVLGAIIEAQEEVGHPFVYENKVLTPFHVAVNHGYTSTVIRLMQSWPAPSSAVTAANSPYTVVDEIGRNILHLAAADNKKEMVQGILKYCPEKYKDEILKQQDTNGDTPLHLLISHGCFIPELIKHKGLDTMPRNKNNFTPWDMLYLKNDVVADQVLIKIALDDVQTNQSSWNLWAKSTEKKTDIWKSIPPSKRRIKDVIFDERKKLLMDAKYDQKKKDLERYKMRTNTQIIVTALITTVTFTVGFTMPGGLYQSGDVHEGLVVLSKRRAFNVFMVSDALALLLSTSSLFFYFLESMNEDPHQVSKLNAASTVLNIVSVVAMMLTFISGTYVVLSHSPVIAFTVCFIGSLFFLLIIVLLIKMVYDRQVKRNEY